MRALTTDEMRTIEGGWVGSSMKCPLCGKKVKISLKLRIGYLFQPKTAVERDVMLYHSRSVYNMGIKH